MHSKHLLTRSTGHARQLRIGIDTWPLESRFRHTGIYVYGRNLLMQFRQMAEAESIEFMPLVCRQTREWDEFRAAGCRPHESPLARIGRAWRYGGACISARAANCDVLFCPSGTTLPLARIVPVVSTIHDIIPIKFPEIPKARALRFEFGKAARSSIAVITDSFNSKQDLISVFDLPPSKVHVVYLACDRATFNETTVDPAVSSALLKKLSVTRGFIFHHGRVQARKNLKRLVEAYDLLLSRNPNLEFDLVLVGDLGSQDEEILRAADNVCPRARVIFAGPQSDFDLSVLLKAARLVVIPSFYEGFCLPLLEAMACGAPTICSNSSCLPEISGGVLRYFDPTSTEEMAACMEQALEDAELRAELSSQGKKRAAFFSWRRCAEETMEVLKTAARS
jgi:glycosyltransferase involved in cell wall biosynthesis